jgi:hypothetical protein
MEINLKKPEIRKMDKQMLTNHVSKMQTYHKDVVRGMIKKSDVLKKRVRNKDELIKNLRYQVFVMTRRLYAQKLRYSKEKTIAKNAMYDKAINNIVSKRKELIDIPKYHMALFELSKVFEKPEMFIILLLWASRYEYYSKKEFELNFKNSPIRFTKYNRMLLREGYANKWEVKRSSYFISAKGKELVEKINKFVYNRLNG